MSINKENIQEIIQTFSPKIQFEDLQNIVKNHIEVENDALYASIEDIATKLKPSEKDKYESKWSYVYLPIKRDGGFQCTAVSIFLSYKKLYYLTFDDISKRGGVAVNKGQQEPNKDYSLILDEINRFLPLVNTYGTKLIEQIYHYQWRVGRIKRKYICDPLKLIKRGDGKQLLASYKNHLEKKLTVSEISLKDYLKTAGLCYRAAFPDEIKEIAHIHKVKEVTDEMLHKRWADDRHGGMLFLKDPNSTKEFMDWYLSDSWKGAHPFEIVYSSNIHGITLHPPDEKEPYYNLSVVDSSYNIDFLKMMSALIANDVPFVVYGLEKILEHCMGEAYIVINTLSMDEMFMYKHTPTEQKKYFEHIEWDPIKILQPVVS